MPLAPAPLSAVEHIKRQGVFESLQGAKPKGRFAVIRDEKGHRGRFDLERVHPLERAAILRRSEKISKARPSHERYQFIFDGKYGTKEAFLNDQGAFEATNLYLGKKARRLLPDLSEKERFLVRFYGRYGLGLNHALRSSKKMEGIYRPIETYDENAYQDTIWGYRGKFEDYKWIIGFPRVESSWFLYDKVEKLTHRFLFANEELSRIIRSLLNDMIDRYSYRHSTGGYFYRVSRALKDVFSGGGYSNPDGTSSLHAPGRDAMQDYTINPGDLVGDWAIISAASNIENNLFEYSAEGARASNEARIPENEEEIIFAIKKTPALKYMDISGHKFPMQEDYYNSDEVMIKSNTRFRVLAIQDKPKEYPRRVVHLEAEDEYYENDIVRNMYDGSMIMGDEI